MKTSRLLFTALLGLLPGLAPTWSAAQLNEQDGVSLELAYTSDFFANAAGGVEKGAVYLDNVDLTGTFDLQRLAGWRGATAFLYVLGNRGSSPSDLVGDMQGVSNMDAPDTWKLYEAWIEQALAGDRLFVKAGLYDLNSEFDVIGSGGLFLNSSHGIGPDFAQTGVNGPSIFPTTSLAVRVRARPTEALCLQVVVLDAVSGNPDDPFGTHVILDSGEGALVAAEVAVLSRDDEGLDGGKLSVGGFWYSAPTEVFSQAAGSGTAGVMRSNRGVYVLMDQPLFREFGEREQGLNGFVRVGIADSRVNQVGSYVGAGLVYTGLVPGRDEDQLGFALATARNGAEFRASERLAGNLFEGSETALELTYALAGEWFTVQPDVQYIINPGTDPGLDNAVAFGLRVGVSF